MRRSLLVSVCLLAAGLAGCTLCPSPYDCDYGFYGGSWQRDVPSQGRVGSAFNNAGGPINPPQEEPIQTPDEPTPSDAPDRPTTPTPLRPHVDEGVQASSPHAYASSRRNQTSGAWSGGFTGGRNRSAQELESPLSLTGTHRVAWVE
jgi:hypothetical protein